MTALKASPQLRKAAERELRLIAARRERLEERRARLDTELKAATDALAALKLRAELVDMLIDEPADAGSDSVAGTVLRGARIREVAIQLLYRRDGYGKVVHYRQWYDLLTEHGYVVLAKDPLASFLVNVGRSPFVTRGNQPGTYAVDGDAEGRLRQQLVEAQAEFRDVCAVIARDGGSPSDREHRTRLNAHVRMLERHAAEAERIFAPAEPRAGSAPAAEPAGA